MDKYNMALIAEMDYKVDMDEAKKEGRKEAMIILAKKMREMGKPIEEIVKLTNISEEKIRSL